MPCAREGRSPLANARGIEAGWLRCRAARFTKSPARKGAPDFYGSFITPRGPPVPPLPQEHREHVLSTAAPRAPGAQANGCNQLGLFGFLKTCLSTNYTGGQHIMSVHIISKHQMTIFRQFSDDLSHWYNTFFVKLWTCRMASGLPSAVSNPQKAGAVKKAGQAFPRRSVGPGVQTPGRPLNIQEKRNWQKKVKSGARR